MSYCYYDKNGKLRSVPSDEDNFSDVHTEYDFDDVVQPKDPNETDEVEILPKGAISHVQAAMRKANSYKDCAKLVAEIEKLLKMEMSFKDRQVLRGLLDGARRNQLEFGKQGGA